MPRHAIRDIPALMEFVKIDDVTGCWLWQRSLTTPGYVQLIVDGRRWQGHRYVWFLSYGTEPDGELDHLCRVRHCLNPRHMEDVTHRENVLRGTSLVARQVVQTECKRGHPLSGDNLRVYTSKSGARRICVACERAANRRKKGTDVPHPPRVCPNCGGEFVPGRSDQRWCSLRCGNQVRTARFKALAS